MKRDWTSPTAEAVGIDGKQFDPGQAIDFEDFFENAAVALHVVGADGTIQYANQAELELLGYAKEAYVVRPIGHFPVDQDVIKGILARLANGEKIEKVPARVRARDGSIKNIEITSSPHFVDGTFVQSRCFSVDVTELKLARAELERKDEHFRQILDSLPVAVYTTDAAGVITYSRIGPRSSAPSAHRRAARSGAHHVHILTMNGDSYRLRQSAGRRRAAASADGAAQNHATVETGDQADMSQVDPTTV